MNVKASTEEKIRWQNSLTNASNIVSKLLDPSAHSLVEIKDHLKEFANFFYNIEPDITELQKKIDACTTLIDLDAIKEEVRATDSVSFFAKWNDKRISFDKK